MSQASRSKIPWERAKLALIPVLLLVLAGVLYWPSDDSAAESVPTLVTQPAVPSLGQSTTHPANATKPKIRWPEYSLNEVIAFSPFDPLPMDEGTQAALASADSVQPSDAGGALPSPSQPTTKTLKAETLQAIYHDGRTAVALINSRLVRPGDLLEEGVRVVEITSAGVVVEVE
jgi:hypothetical protein